MRQRRFPCLWRGANLVVRAAASTPPVSGPGGERAGCATGDRRHVSPAFLLVLPAGIPSLRPSHPRRWHALPLQARALPAALVAATGAGFQRSRSNTPRLRCAARCCCIGCGGRLHAVCASRRQDGEGNPMTGAAGMRGPRGGSAGRWMVAWGLLDLAYFAHYVVDSIGRGMTPLLGDLAAARDTAAVHGNAVPVWVAAASLLVYVSLPVSGVLLLQRRPAGAWLAAVPALPRLLLAAPTGAILL